MTLPTSLLKYERGAYCEGSQSRLWKMVYFVTGSESCCGISLRALCLQQVGRCWARSCLSSVSCHPGAREDLPQDVADLQARVLPGHIQTASTCVVCWKGFFNPCQQVLFLEDKREKNTPFIGLHLSYLWATGLQSSFTFRPLWICVWFYWCGFFSLIKVM